MELRPLTEENMEQVRIWRHEVPETLRTSYMLTKEMQQDYYRNVICNRNSTTRYWGLYGDCGDLQPEKECPHFFGYGGIENISWENRNGEMSLLIAPQWRMRPSMVVQEIERLMRIRGVQQGDLYRE